MNWVGNVQHGLPFDLLPFSSQANGGYLAFLGRISPEKGPEAAIEIASRAGLPLKLAAKIDKADRSYWNDRVEPLVNAHPNVEFVGEIGEREKAGFLGNARALLFPIDWPEPFGLVMIEALACGTPVVAFPCGAVAEVIEDGTSGFIVRNVDEAVGAIGRIGNVSRRQVRAAFDRRFTARQMAENYLAIYRRLVGERFDTARIRRAHGELPKLRAITS
jgi:glycosyltransferase involved in cell wall biosynthesis